MTALLPQGLVNATVRLGQPSLDDSDASVTNSEVLRKFWKGLLCVHLTSHLENG